MEFSFETLKNKYSKRVGNYKGRDVIVRSKYDDLGDNVYILYDAEGMLPSAPPRGCPLVVDGYVVAYINEDGGLNRCREFKWEPVSPTGRPLACPEGNESGDSDISLDVDTSLADSLLESAYDDILTPLMYNE